MSGNHLNLKGGSFYLCFFLILAEKKHSEKFPSESHSHADISNTNPILLNAFLLLHEYSERIFFMSDIINPGERV